MLNKLMNCVTALRTSTGHTPLRIRADYAGVIFAKRNMEVIIDWSTIATSEESYNVFLLQVDAPSWHGRNLDALNDSLVSGDINGINPLYKIISLNISSAPIQIQAHAGGVMHKKYESASKQ